MKITTDFCGGNAHILEKSETEVLFLPELRDTEGDWFYWAFCAEGAQGRTVTFRLDGKSWLGYFGPAVSRDLLHWQWSDSVSDDHMSFTYTFAADEDRVYFAHDMLYHPSQFTLFCERSGLHPSILCADRRLTPVPYVTVGSGEYHMLLTARHHCCESTGNYVMEGILSELLEYPMEHFTVTAVPFVDADGVVRGDQGKNRRPHDHNRDYMEAIYPAVRAVRERSLGCEGKLLCVFDLHSPWHIGGRNDKVFIVRNASQREDLLTLGRLFEAEMTPGALQYRTINDIEPGEEWNVIGEPLQCAAWHQRLPGVLLSATLETAYFGERGNVVTQDNMRETGRCWLRAVKKFLQLKGIG
ncbi:MAG: M14-type cytosolic carboxypeptidase [Eubacteriales bacterium]